MLTSTEALDQINSQLKEEGINLGPKGFTYDRLYRLLWVYPAELGAARLGSAPKRSKAGRGGGILFRKSALKKFKFANHIKQIHTK